MSDVTQVNLSPRPMVARSARSVRVFVASRPQRPFVDVATLAVTQTHQLNARGDSLMIEELRKQAGQLGCDGVVLGSTSEHHGYHDGDALLYWADPDATIMRATCIVYLPDPEEARARAERRRAAAEARAAALRGGQGTVDGAGEAAGQDDDTEERRHQSAVVQRFDWEEPR